MKWLFYILRDWRLGVCTRARPTPQMNGGLGASILHRGCVLLLGIVMSVAIPGLPALAQQPCGATVTVRAGDTLYRIAARCNTTIQTLLALNPQIRNRNLIYRGQQLALPEPADETPGAATVTIEPNAGPPGAALVVTAHNFPANTEVIVGIGEPASEPITNFRSTANAAGTLNTEIPVPAAAQPNQRLVVVVYVPGQGGTRATSPEFTVTSGQTEASVIVTPAQGSPATIVQIQAGGFAPHTPVELGFGRVESEYDIIAQAVTDGNGGLTRQVQVPSFAKPGDQYVFVVTPQGSPTEVVSNVLTVTGDGQAREPQVAITPRAGAPGTNVQATVRDFPPNTRISYGFGEPDGQLLALFSTRTNRSGAAQVTLPVPTFVDPDITLTLTAFVPQQGGASATSAAFTVTGQQDDNGQNLFTRTNIYLVALEDGGQSGMAIGCGDSVVPVEVTIEPTIAPLTAALNTLFGLDERFYGQSGLYNALYRSDLTVDRITLTKGIATIYLTGQLQVGGVCDEPRVRAQLEETALQYYTVDEVQIFVNGEPLAF